MMRAITRAKKLPKLRSIAAAALAVFMLLQGSLGWADDTEIYLSKADTSGKIKPNILFVLDDSVSMNWSLKSQSRCESERDNPPCPKTRLEVLKETMTSLLEKMKNVNVGLMTLRADSKDSTVAPILSPIQDIDIELNRKNIQDAITNLTADSYTPIAGTLYDAARYLNTDQPDYTFTDNKGNTHSYKSPLSECQPNHMVLLTDGLANKSSGRIRSNIISLAKLTGTPACKERGNSEDDNGETCAVELVQWMHNSDQSSKHDGVQTVTAHTIGFALEADKQNKEGIKKFLKDLASAGGGEAKTADDANQLNEAFKAILQAAQVKNATFVNPSAASSNADGTKHREEIYYPLFLPKSQDRWPGNLKRYNLKREGDALLELGINGEKAKLADGTFNPRVQSWWSVGVDGDDISKGGAAWQLPENPNERNLWVVMGNSLKQLPMVQTQNDGSIVVQKPDDKVAAITAGDLKLTGDQARIDRESKELLRYVRGFESDGNTPRHALGDALHSAPVLFSYRDSSGKELRQMAVMGTNEGFVHLFDTQSGVEEFAFMPDMLFKNIKTLYDNKDSAASNSHPYGMDNTVTLWQNDEKVYLYATMRRGGNGIYALDISKPEQPKFLWKIVGGESAGFERLGQTWSKPVKTKVSIGGLDKDVLIFAGGYDTQQDSPANWRVLDKEGQQLGNAIYMVDAKNGDLLWYASSSKSPKAADSVGYLHLPDMKYSIPAAVRVIDLSATDDGERLAADARADQFFVGDSGGLVWRFFIHNGSAASSLVTAGGENGVLFDAAKDTPSGHGANSRRFYHEPDVALMDGSSEKLAVNIGSGYRAHPLDTVVKDQMYSLHIALHEGSDRKLSQDDLVNVTELFDSHEIALQMAGSKMGWRIELKTAGEKVISTPLTVEGKVSFNTYLPSTGAIKCAPAIGSNRSYNVSLLDAMPARKAEVGQTVAAEARFTLSKAQGTLGNPSVICLANKCWVQYGPGEFGDPFGNESLLGRKTYWIDLAQ